MNLVKIADMLKNASDQNLMQEMQNPSGSVPSYMVLSELQRRKKLRGSLMNEEPQTSVAEDMEMESARANQMGIGAFDPYAQAPQEAPVGMASGGEVKGYAAGDYVGDYEDPLSWEERMQMWRERTGFGRMAPQPQPTFPGAAASQVRAADNRILAANPTLTVPRAAAAPVAPLAPPAAGLPAAAQAAPAASPTDYGKEFKDIAAKQAEAYQKQADLYAQQVDEVKKSRSSDIGLALMQAGLGIAGGRSQYAMENIGQGAMPAMQAYIGMDRARREQAQKLALGQGALGIEQLGAQLKSTGMGAEYGLGKEKLGIEREKVGVMRQAAAAQSNRETLQDARLNAQYERDLTKEYLKAKGMGETRDFFSWAKQEFGYAPARAPAAQNKLTGDAKSGYRYGY